MLKPGDAAVRLPQVIRLPKRQISVFADVLKVVQTIADRGGVPLLVVNYLGTDHPEGNRGDAFRALRRFLGGLDLVDRPVS